MKALPNNILVNHPAYPKILDAYNTILKADGRVNNKKFWSEVILPEIPTYALQTWYSFLHRFKTQYGIAKAEVTFNGPYNAPRETIAEEEKGISTTLLSNQAATVALVSSVLNISALAAKKLIEHPELMSEKDKIELGFKVMKAQDSRIHAVGKIREDSREQEKFDRAFDSAQFS